MMNRAPEDKNNKSYIVKLHDNNIKDTFQILEHSIAFHMRRTHRIMNRLLQDRLALHNIPIGMWYFLRVLWEKDGMTQRELSDMVTSTAATTVE